MERMERQAGRGGSPPSARRPPGRGRLVVAVAAALALLVLAVSLLVWIVFVEVPRQGVETARQAGSGAVEVAEEGARAAVELASDVAARLRDSLGLAPRVTVDDRVVQESSRDILELATVERRVVARHTVTHTFLGSTKRLRLTGIYTVKAGFDLADGFDLEVTSGGPPGPEGVPPMPRFEFTVGAPKLLSVEQMDVSVEEDEGLWNRVQTAERERALADLQRLARLEALRAGILEDARVSLRNRLQQALLDEVAPTEVHFERPRVEIERRRP